jgi:Mg2+-importing ATPase
LIGFSHALRPALLVLAPRKFVVVIVTISVTIDFVQEVRAQNAIEALRRSVAVQATVRRNGACLSVPIDRLVPGDVVELIAGDLVPADSRLT